MKKHIKAWLTACTMALLSVALPAQAQLTAGRDFTLITPAQPTDNPAKIEVIEYFSYGCPHCKDLNPLVSSWASKLPADVSFKRVPVSFGRPQWTNLAKLYYALDVTGDLTKLDGAVFHALHEEGLDLSTDKNIAEWVTGKGVDAKKFSDAYKSFSVISNVNRADQMAQSSKISGVPAMVVDGRYLVLGQGIKSHADLLALTDKIIDKARSEHKSKPVAVKKAP